MMQNNPNQIPIARHPLLSKFDADPGAWRPFYYGLKVDVGVKIDAVGRGSINLNNQPFIMTTITSQIIGPTLIPESGYYQDGMFDISWKDEQSVYQNEPIPVELFCNSVRSGYVLELPYPIPYAGNKTLTFEVYNRVQRPLVSPESEFFRVAICVAGIANWGTVLPQRG